jgi:hypothetical protein
MSTIGELGNFIAKESAASMVKTPDDISALVQPAKPTGDVTGS